MAEYATDTIFRTYPRITAGILGKSFLAELLDEVTELVHTVAVKIKTTAISIDLEDVQNSRSGDAEAYRRLIERHQEHVAKITWRFSRNRQVHEELVQDVFVEAYLSLRKYRGDASFAHWLSAIATRLGYRYWKRTERRRRIKSLTLEEWDQWADKKTDALDPGEAGSIVHNLLSKLPPRDRLVLILRFIEQCDVAETARRTGWTKTMVKVQTSRARKKLQRLLQSHKKELMP